MKRLWFKRNTGTGEWDAAWEDGKPGWVGRFCGIEKNGGHTQLRVAVVDDDGMVEYFVYLDEPHPRFVGPRDPTNEDLAFLEEI